MVFDWSLLTLATLVSIYLFIKMYYFKNMTIKDAKSNVHMRETIDEAEVLIRKYQVQLQRSLGNIDIISEELSKQREEIKSLKKRNSTHRADNDKLRHKIKDLESKIDALL